MSIPSFVEEAQKLYTNGETEDCIDFLISNLGKDERSFDLIDLKRRINTLQQKVNRGLISYDDQQIESNQINNSLLEVIKALKSGKTSLPAAAPKETGSNRTLVFGAIGAVALLLALYFIVPMLSGAESADSSQENATATTDPPPKEEASTVTLDCGSNGEFVNGKCKCKDAYDGDQCQNRITPTKHISSFKDNKYYAIESVAIPGWDITIMAKEDNQPGDYYTLEEAGTAIIYNGNVFSLLRSPKNDFYTINVNAQGGGVLTEDPNNNSIPALMRQFGHNSKNQHFRLLAVGDEGHFSIQALSNKDLFLRTYGKSQRVFFSTSYTDPQALFKLREVIVGSY